MSTLAGNENNDIFIDATGELALDTGIQAVLDDCETAIKAQRGEMVEAVNQGIPTAETVWDRKNIQEFETACVVALRAVPNVVEVESFDTVQVANTLEYTAVIITTFGEGSFNGQL